MGIVRERKEMKEKKKWYHNHRQRSSATAHPSPLTHSELEIKPALLELLDLSLPFLAASETGVMRHIGPHQVRELRVDVHGRRDVHGDVGDLALGPDLPPGLILALAGCGARVGGRSARMGLEDALDWGRGVVGGEEGLAGIA
jgi:hypothetical protein